MNVGKVLAYSDDVGRGVIICEDAKKYNFDVQDWDSFESSPKVGMQVSFELSEQNEPLRIRIVSDIETYTPSNDVVDLDAKEIEVPKKSYNDLGMQNCIDAFFVFFEDEIREDKHLRLESKELDFLKIKRFLYTAYNNLLEIDTGFENYILADIKNSLDRYYELYKKFKNQTKYIKTTFERVFLDKQEEYKKLIVDIEINRLHSIP